MRIMRRAASDGGVLASGILVGPVIMLHCQPAQAAQWEHAMPQSKEQHTTCAQKHDGLAYHSDLVTLPQCREYPARNASASCLLGPAR